MTEGPSQSNETIENPYREADEIVNLLKSVSFRLKTEPEKFIIVDESLGKWVPVLFNAARSVSGIKKTQYAMALKTIGEYADEDDYQNILRSLMTTTQAVDELIQQGLKEMDPITKIGKKIGGFFKKKNS